MNNYIIKSVFLILTSLSIITLSAFSAPLIEVDTQHVNLGTIREGTVKKVQHSFKIFNKGDQPLIISKVKAG